MKTKYIIFDLDDTLMYEVDYLKSAYKELAEIIDPKNKDELFEKMFELYKNGKNVFDILVERFPSFSKGQLLEIYRNHFPNISLNDGAKEIFDFCREKKYKIGLITDGRSVTQRNKLKALGIENIFDKIIVSEEFGSTKPDERNFKTFIEEGIDTYFYIADNPKKDFVTPNNLGWTSVCLLNQGKNIHSQYFESEDVFLLELKINKLSELKKIL